MPIIMATIIAMSMFCSPGYMSSTDDKVVLPVELAIGSLPISCITSTTISPVIKPDVIAKVPKDV